MKATIASERRTKSTGPPYARSGTAGVAWHDRPRMGEALIIDAVRTPIGRYRRRPRRASDPTTSRRARSRPRSSAPASIRPMSPTSIWGAANQAGEDNRDVARMAALLAGLPVEVPGVTVNRLCASGLEAINQASRALRLDEGDLYLAGGSESMSRAPWVMAKPEPRPRPWRADDARHRARLALRSTPRWRSATRPRRWARPPRTSPSANRISREDQDAFALRSHERAVAAQARGPLRRRAGARSRLRADARHPSSTPTRGPARTPRSSGSPRLRPAFREGGTVTAGNASTLNDGAACLVLASERRPRSSGAQPLARIVATGVAGVDPAYMGIGPVPAIRRALDAAGLRARRDRPDRDQRGVRRPGARLRARARDRRGAAERQRRRDRARPPARLLGRPADDHARLGAAPARRPLRHRGALRRRRSGRRDGDREPRAA